MVVTAGTRRLLGMGAWVSGAWAVPGGRRKGFVPVAVVFPSGPRDAAVPPPLDLHVGLTQLECDVSRPNIDCNEQLSSCAEAM